MKRNGRIRLFELGEVVATKGALTEMRKHSNNLEAYCLEFIERHASGDWGEVPPEDKAANDRAVLDGSRILSAYRLPDGQKIWIISESDRSVTTILLPSEY